MMKREERIEMTRCVFLDEWFDVKSKEVDKKESKTKKCFVTGEKKCVGKLFLRNLLVLEQHKI